MEIDIRNVDDGITSIRFADTEEDIVEGHGTYVDIARIEEGRVRIKDIDNLIKALEKAKEIWWTV